MPASTDGSDFSRSTPKKKKNKKKPSTMEENGTGESAIPLPWYLAAALEKERGWISVPNSQDTADGATATLEAKETGGRASLHSCKQESISEEEQNAADCKGSSEGDAGNRAAEASPEAAAPKKKKKRKRSKSIKVESNEVTKTASEMTDKTDVQMGAEVSENECKRGVISSQEGEFMNEGRKQSVHTESENKTVTLCNGITNYVQIEDSCGEEKKDVILDGVTSDSSQDKSILPCSIFHPVSVKDIEFDVALDQRSRKQDMPLPEKNGPKSNVCDEKNSNCNIDNEVETMTELDTTKWKSMGLIGKGAVGYLNSTKQSNRKECVLISNEVETKKSYRASTEEISSKGDRKDEDIFLFEKFVQENLHAQNGPKLHDEIDGNLDNWILNMWETLTSKPSKSKTKLKNEMMSNKEKEETLPSIAKEAEINKVDGNSASTADLKVNVNLGTKSVENMLQTHTGQIENHSTVKENSVQHFTAKSNTQTLPSKPKPATEKKDITAVNEEIFDAESVELAGPFSACVVETFPRSAVATFRFHGVSTRAHFFRGNVLGSTIPSVGTNVILEALERVTQSQQTLQYKSTLNAKRVRISLETREAITGRTGHIAEYSDSNTGFIEVTLPNKEMVLGKFIRSVVRAGAIPKQKSLQKAWPVGTMVHFHGELVRQGEKTECLITHVWPQGSAAVPDKTAIVDKKTDAKTPEIAQKKVEVEKVSAHTGCVSEYLSSGCGLVDFRLGDLRMSAEFKTGHCSGLLSGKSLSEQWPPATIVHFDGQLIKNGHVVKFEISRIWAGKRPAFVTVTPDIPPGPHIGEVTELRPPAAFVVTLTLPKGVVKVFVLSMYFRMSSSKPQLRKKLTIKGVVHLGQRISVIVKRVNSDSRKDCDYIAIDAWPETELSADSLANLKKYIAASNESIVNPELKPIRIQPELNPELKQLKPIQPTSNSLKKSSPPNAASSQNVSTSVGSTTPVTTTTANMVPRTTESSDSHGSSITQVPTNNSKISSLPLKSNKLIKPNSSVAPEAFTLSGASSSSVVSAPCVAECSQAKNNALTISTASVTPSTPNTTVSLITPNVKTAFGAPLMYNVPQPYRVPGFFNAPQSHVTSGPYYSQQQYGAPGVYRAPGPYDVQAQHGFPGPHGAPFQYGFPGPHSASVQYAVPGAHGTPVPYGGPGPHGPGMPYSAVAPYGNGVSFDTPTSYGPSMPYSTSVPYNAPGPLGPSGSHAVQGPNTAPGPHVVQEPIGSYRDQIVNPVSVTSSSQMVSDIQSLVTSQTVSILNNAVGTEKTTTSVLIGKSITSSAPFECSVSQPSITVTMSANSTKFNNKTVFSEAIVSSGQNTSFVFASSEVDDTSNVTVNCTTMNNAISFNNGMITGVTFASDTTVSSCGHTSMTIANNTACGVSNNTFEIFASRFSDGLIDSARPVWSTVTRDSCLPPISVMSSDPIVHSSVVPSVGSLSVGAPVPLNTAMTSDNLVGKNVFSASYSSVTSKNLSKHTFSLDSKVSTNTTSSVSDTSPETDSTVTSNGTGTHKAPQSDCVPEITSVAAEFFKVAMPISYTTLNSVAVSSNHCTISSQTVSSVQNIHNNSSNLTGCFRSMSSTSTASRSQSALHSTPVVHMQSVFNAPLVQFSHLNPSLQVPWPSPYPYRVPSPLMFPLPAGVHPMHSYPNKPAMQVLPTSSTFPFASANNSTQMQMATHFDHHALKPQLELSSSRLGPAKFEAALTFLRSLEAQPAGAEDGAQLPRAPDASRAGPPLRGCVVLANSAAALLRVVAPGRPADAPLVAVHARGLFLCGVVLAGVDLTHVLAPGQEFNVHFLREDERRLNSGEAEPAPRDASQSLQNCVYVSALWLCRARFESSSMQCAELNNFCKTHKVPDAVHHQLTMRLGQILQDKKETNNIPMQSSDEEDESIMEKNMITSTLQLKEKNLTILSANDDILSDDVEKEVHKELNEMGPKDFLRTQFKKFTQSVLDERLGAAQEFFLNSLKQNCSDINLYNTLASEVPAIMHAAIEEYLLQKLNQVPSNGPKIVSSGPAPEAAPCRACAERAAAEAADAAAAAAAAQAAREAQKGKAVIGAVTATVADTAGTATTATVTTFAQESELATKTAEEATVIDRPANEPAVAPAVCEDTPLCSREDDGEVEGDDEDVDCWEDVNEEPEKNLHRKRSRGAAKNPYQTVRFIRGIRDVLLCAQEGLKTSYALCRDAMQETEVEEAKIGVTTSKVEVDQERPPVQFEEEERSKETNTTDRLDETNFEKSFGAEIQKHALELASFREEACHLIENWTTGDSPPATPEELVFLQELSLLLDNKVEAPEKNEKKDDMYSLARQLIKFWNAAKFPLTPVAQRGLRRLQELFNVPENTTEGAVKMENPGNSVEGVLEVEAALREARDAFRDVKHVFEVQRCFRDLRECFRDVRRAYRNREPRPRALPPCADAPAAAAAATASAETAAAAAALAEAVAQAKKRGRTSSNAFGSRTPSPVGTSSHSQPKKKQQQCATCKAKVAGGTGTSEPAAVTSSTTQTAAGRQAEVSTKSSQTATCSANDSGDTSVNTTEQAAQTISTGAVLALQLLPDE